MNKKSRASIAPVPYPVLEKVGLAQALVAHVYGVTIDEMMAPTRARARACHARQVAMYLLHVVYSLTMAEVGKAFGRDASTAMHACHRIEDLRDDRDVDRTVSWLEVLLRGAMGLGG
jgi:chromosomal replication initiation ATPase DnaA